MPRRGGGDQVRTIARATFDGFLQSDLMPPGMQAPAIIWAANPSLTDPVSMIVDASEGAQSERRKSGGQPPPS